ncbi:efflux transporter outer membrane subunit [Ideonella azotifigens]|uniref:Efflux transporter outer membrane subunit n=1 Tax=Ideonella azotifigens TaxID=513160 RepID=A0ABN1JWC9_9BURK|nr:efflux transporter outer membrane subunit [Ideonella azotifigens]
MRRGFIAIWSAACVAACSQAPLMHLPEIPSATAFKEAPPAVAGTEMPPLQWDSWWQAFGDPALDGLEQQLLQNSPDLASALARYQQARAATDALRAAESPALGTSLNVQRNRQSDRRPLRVLGPNSPDEYNSATLGLDFQYELDLWGRVKQQVAAGSANERAAQADLAAARLALQAQLADTLVALRGLDQEARLLQETEAAYQRAAELIGRRHDAGIASGLDLARAEGQLASTRSQLRQSRAQRAVQEHAIAALVGASASSFSLPAEPVPMTLPQVPLLQPSTLLQRRPDVLAAQQRVLAANASAGAARAAFFPAVQLSGQAGFQSSDLGRFIEMPNLFWALGPTLVFNLLDGGRRQADNARANAAVEEAAQRYRGVVLAAFQQTEDQLALLGRYGEAAVAEREATVATARALALATNRYNAGAASYLEVVSSQTANLQAQRSALDLGTRQRRATVQLVRALGGGWSAELAQTAAAATDAAAQR